MEMVLSDSITWLGVILRSHELSIAAEGNVIQYAGKNSLRVFLNFNFLILLTFHICVIASSAYGNEISSKIPAFLSYSVWQNVESKTTYVC
jgi:hypothetical protein